MKLIESGQAVSHEVKRKISDRLNPQLETGNVEYFSTNPEKSKKGF
ncbi:MAG: hypothetical protein Q9M92_15060 [Enterobacterales bacterium]|nr:hypothetical protein [Enterobacterales bacterium]